MATENPKDSKEAKAEEKAFSKPTVGISIGDINGISFELIFKTFADERVLNYCTPVIYASSRVANYHKKTLGYRDFNFNVIKSADKAQSNQINLINAWQEEAKVQLGHIQTEAGTLAKKSLDACVHDLSSRLVDAMVTAPSHKHTFEEANLTGHTEYLQHYFESENPLMLMTHEHLKVGLVTTHLPVKDVASNITQEGIQEKIEVLNNTLIRDYHFYKPKIAVLGLNPHAGDQGLIGDEDQAIVEPAIQKAYEKGEMAFGPFPADGFFGTGHYKQFEGVLAMYHDQGLVPFKALTFGEGVNFTAGLPIVRTSPDHGPGYAIAGKDLANEGSFREAVFQAVKLYQNRETSKQLNSNPLSSKSLNKEPEDS